MNSDESEANPHKRKRKIRRLSDDSQASTSSLSPIVGGPSNRRRRKVATIREESPDSESSDSSGVVFKRKKVGRVQSNPDMSSSDDDSSPIIANRKWKKQILVSESESSESSGSDIVPRRTRSAAAPLSMTDSECSDSQWESDFSDSDNEASNKPKAACPSVPEEKAIDSDSSDGQSEKCPICLLSFRLQEVGIPENCEHTFCLECIQEWSKNMNTCPVDRKEYNSITVKKSINGRFLRKVQIERPEVQEDAVDIVEDPTYCEICGSNDHEDRLLLCDGCDLGFHLYCLTPPLEEVPEGTWFCNDCYPGVNQEIDYEEVARLYDDLEENFGGPLVTRRSTTRRQSTRLVPRTRQTERVRRRIETNRNRRQQQNFELDEDEPTSSRRVNSSRISSSTRKHKKKSNKKRKSKKTRSAQYRTVYVIDKVTGEAVPVKRKIKSRRAKKKRKSRRYQTERAAQKTVKTRLAAQLGMCTSNSVPQALPDIRLSNSNSDSIGQRRYQAGIPSLDIVGSRLQLEYFSQSEDEGISNDREVGGVHTLLARRASNPLDVLSLRRVARRKAGLINVPTVSSSTDILGSIMDSQEKFLSKSSILSVVDSSGKLQIENKKSEPILNNNSPNKPDFNSYSVKQKPWYGGGRHNTGYRYQNRNWSNNRNWQNNYRGNQGGYYSGPSNTYDSAGSGSGTNYMQGGDQNNDIPQDYTQRTLCEAELLQDTEDKDKRTPGSNTPLSDTDVDIYGDIENVPVSTSTSQEELRPPSPPMMQQQSNTPNTNTDEDNDSESGMVIDTERYQDEPVTSTVGIVPGQAYTPEEPTYSPGHPTYSPEHPTYSPEHPTYNPDQPPPYNPDQLPPFNPDQPPPFNPDQLPPFNPDQPPPFNPDQPPPFNPNQPPPYNPNRPPPYNPDQPPPYNPDQPTYSPGHPTYSPEKPTYSPGEPTYSPGEPTPYDPPESEPENASGYGQANSDVSGYEQLQEIASGYDELQREIASGYDQLQREFASSFNQSQSGPDHQEKTDLDCSRSEPDVTPDQNQFEPENNLSYRGPSSENDLDHNHQVKDSESDQTRPKTDLDSAPPEIKATADVGVTDKNSAVITPIETEYNKEDDNGHQKFDDEEYSNDGCPNFSIYSRESKTVALTTDISLPPSARDQPEPPLVEESNENSTNVEAEPERLINESIDQITDESESLPAMPQKETTAMTVEKTFGPGSDPRLKKQSSSGFWNLGGLYSDSEDESVVKKSNTFGISDIKDMTEDIVSEEERSYTPTLDENARKSKEGLEGLDTEMISDEDRNDFDESHELKTVSDGDALEINAKESELEFTRPEEFEEGEIVDKNKDNPVIEELGGTPEKPRSPDKNKEKDKDKSDKKTDKENKKKKKEKGKNRDRSKSADGGANKENENRESFKKLTRSNKERNYRDKDKGDKDKETSKQNRERSRSKTPVKSNDRERETKKKKEKRKDLERYNVRAIIAEKPRPPPKDQFGRDLPSRSRSRSYTPPLLPMSPIARRSPSPIRAPRSLSRRKSRSASRGKTPPRGHRSVSRRRSGSRIRDKSRKRRSRSRHRTHSRSKSRGRKRDRSKNKKRKRSRSKSNKRKKSKEKDRTKTRKRSRKSGSRTRRRSSRSLSGSPRQIRRDWTPSFSRSPTPPPMSPSWTPPRTDNSQALRNQNLTVILNNDAAKKKRDKRNRDRRRKDDPASKRRRRERERTPPPSKEVFASGDNILVSVSFNNENETRDVSTRDNRKRKEAAAAEQQKKNKERRNKNKKDLSGVKPVAIIDLERSPFQEITASPKDVIVLSDSDNNENENGNIHADICDSSQQVASPERTPNYTTGPKTPPEPSIKFTLLPKPQQLRAINNPLHDPLETIEEEMQEELNNSTHKGPNTPPEEPPTSPPSSPDAYDPFEPTKSRSPTPEPMQVEGDVGNEQNLQEPLENRSSIDLLEKSGQTPDVTKSLTPPIAEIQPADSQSTIHENSEPKSPEQRIGVVINQIIQPANGKPVAQTTPFSSVPTSMITSTSVPSSMANSRINIINSSIITSVSSIPQRIVLPNQVKSSPVKISPTKAAVKSTPIKPMQSKNNKKGTRPQNGNSLDDITLDFDSPYSPGSSDYEDLFEPPADLPTATVKPKTHSKSKMTTNTQKHQTTFDALFGSPSYNKKTKRSSSKKTNASNKTKHVGVKIDEDSLKILEELPNSAVEMQVKDKFLKKLNRQERVVEEVKLVLKPYYNKKKITKDEYKDIMRRAVPKICHNKTGEINPIKIRQLIEAYVKKVKHSKKVTSSSSLPQKVV